MARPCPRKPQKPTLAALKESNEALQKFEKEEATRSAKNALEKFSTGQGANLGLLLIAKSKESKISVGGAAVNYF